MLKLPEELQFLEPTKKRELDTNIRIASRSTCCPGNHKIRY